MIHAHSLRSGNLVLLNGETRKVSYACRYSGTIQLTESELQNKDYDVEPIPLTTEWLERCGFEKEKYANIKDTGEWDIKEKWVSQDKELELFYVVLAGKEMIGDNACFARKMKGFHRYMPIKYVHLLQNLFFALTSEELEIKP